MTILFHSKNKIMNFKTIVSLASLIMAGVVLHAQALRLPSPTNHKCTAGRTVGVTDIQVKWNAPGVKGRQGRIWGTDIAYYGKQVLGFGSEVMSPWRAGADECTTISFGTDVTVNGKKLAAGTYALFMELAQDSVLLIFNRNINEWGTYFYDASLDVLRVSTRQLKDRIPMVERLTYTFDNQTENTVEIALEWENWRIPFTVAVDLKETVLTHIKSQMSGALGFDPPSLQAAATWCLTNNVNQKQALNWITSATDPNLGGLKSFGPLSVRAGLLRSLGQDKEADQFMTEAMEVATPIELHQYGRQLLGAGKKAEAMAVFEKNHAKSKGAWPTNVGLMRGYSAMGDLKKALQHARLALQQAPDDINRKNLESAIKTLESGKAL